jgi:hypothetical protein
MSVQLIVNGKSVNLSVKSSRELEKAFAPPKKVQKFHIGDVLEHKNGNEYLLTRIKQYKGYRAYLINMDTGIARNSDKCVMVKGAVKGGCKGYVTDLPARKDQFIDPNGDGVAVI